MSSPVFSVPINTERGRIKRINIPTVMRPGIPRLMICSILTSADRRMNNIPIIKTVSCSLNSSRSCWIYVFELPIVIPAIVTAAIPLSGLIVLET